METMENTVELKDMVAELMRDLKASREASGPRADELIKLDEEKCIFCHGTGYEMYEADGLIFGRECRCGLLKKQRMEGRLRFADIPEEFKNLSVENFRVDCYHKSLTMDRAARVKEIAESYVRHFPEMQERGKGLYLHSVTPGSGKTRMAASIANDIIRKYNIPVKFATTAELLDRIKQTWDKQSSITEAQLLKDIIEVPVLVIDDIGVEGNAGWIQQRFYHILNSRMVNKKVTLFTSNARITELFADVRVKDRIGKMVLQIPFPEESVRENIARDENKEILEILSA